MKAFSLLTVIAVFVISSCGGNQKKNESENTATGSTQAVGPEESSTPTNSNTIEITSNDQLKFNLSEIRVKADQEITLTLKNEGTMPKDAMGHNFVLFKLKTNVEEFAQAAMNSKQTDYIPEALKESILAHTRLLGPGESDTITFTVPKGEYDFICSFPGHHTTMKGKLIAE